MATESPVDAAAVTGVGVGVALTCAVLGVTTWRLRQGQGRIEPVDALVGLTVLVWGSVLSTAGGVVFSGQLTGEFEAFDADTGKKLWQFQTGSGIEGQPVTWQQDGVQYVAVTSGYGGVYSLFSGDERLANVPPGGSLWVFAVKQ